MDLVATTLASVRPTWRDRMPTQGRDRLGFEFLWGGTLEDPAWDGLRRRARSAFTALRAPDNPRPV